MKIGFSDAVRSGAWRIFGLVAACCLLLNSSAIFSETPGNTANGFDGLVAELDAQIKTWKNF